MSTAKIQKNKKISNVIDKQREGSVISCSFKGHLKTTILLYFHIYKNIVDNGKKLYYYFAQDEQNNKRHTYYNEIECTIAVDNPAAFMRYADR